MDFPSLFSLEELINHFDYVTWLKQGGLLGIPTETVYGLGAVASNSVGIEKIYSIKNRPRHNPLIIHYSALNSVFEDAVFSFWALKLAQKFWPGPLTLLLPKKENSSICPQAHAFLPAIAVRIPSHPIALTLLAKTGPLAAPSANRSGSLSPTQALHVLRAFRGSFPVLAGGPCSVGLESTIIDATQQTLRILRPGSLTAKDILSALPGIPLESSVTQSSSQKNITTPGSLLAHYAPQKPIRSEAKNLYKGEGLLAFGSPIPQSSYTIQLSLEKSVDEAAQNFFAALHTMDQAEECQSIAVMPIPNHGIGLAINDRLKKACYQNK